MKHIDTITRIAPRKGFVHQGLFLDIMEFILGYAVEELQVNKGSKET